jgi:thioredoxin-dependent peroxiredoxin
MRPLRPALFLVLAALATPVAAALPVGSKAPDFATTGALGGSPSNCILGINSNMARWCSISIPRHSPRGARWKPRHSPMPCRNFAKQAHGWLGMSTDNLETLQRFSTEACRSAFPVAIASPQTVKAYDVVLKSKPELTDRTSYVIDRSGKIVMVHSELDWKDHVSKTLAAVRSLKK